MKLTLILAFCLVYLSSFCTAQSLKCVNQTDPSGEISDSYGGGGLYKKCWIITVPEDNYVRLVLKETYFNGWSCSNVYVKLTVGGTNEEYKFCSEDKKRMPITAQNDVNVTYYHNNYNTVDRTSFKLNYTSESRICAQKDHFRCSSSHCIHKNQRCDGVKDCKNGADEVSCETGVALVKGINECKKKAITWLKSQRSNSYGWGQNTHRAITALYLSGEARFREGDMEDNLMAKQLVVQTTVALLRNSSDTVSVNELSLFINGLSLTCYRPRHFYGYDLLEILSERVRTARSTSPAAYLTLCTANWKISDPQINSLLNILSTNKGHPFHLDIQALSFMALTCIKNKTNRFYNIENATEIYNASIQKFISRQQPDGSFGNVYTTAMVTQALISSGQESNTKWNLTSTIQYLMEKLNPPSIDFLTVYFIAPIFNRKTLVDMKDFNCEKPRRDGEDEEISYIINKFGGKVQIQYYLYIGDKKDVVHSIYLRMPENSTAYDVMRVAQVANPKYKFLHTNVSGRMYVYEIAGITNDPEIGKFWVLYTKNSSGSGVIPLNYLERPDAFFLKEGINLIMWYKTVRV